MGAKKPKAVKVKKEHKVKAEVKEEDISEEGAEKIKVKEEPGDDKKDKKKKEKKKSKEKKEKSKGPVHITANGEPTPCDSQGRDLDQTHPLWAECKEKMRPM